MSGTPANIQALDAALDHDDQVYVGSSPNVRLYHAADCGFVTDAFQSLPEQHARGAGFSPHTCIEAED